MADERESEERDRRRLPPSEMHSGGAHDPPEIAAARGDGVFWAGEIACPVLLAEFPR
jgi:hypothetical protein